MTQSEPSAGEHGSMSNDPGASGMPGRSRRLKILIAVAIATVSLSTAVAAGGYEQTA